jgi:hypothetical protein
VPSDGPPETLTVGQRLQRRAEAAALRAREQHAHEIEQAQARDLAILGERASRPQTVGEAVDSLMAVFPGASIVEDWQQIGHEDWVDRLTGNVVHEQPRGTVPLIGG